jgi:uncharacterized protein (DUF736 family)
MRVDQLHTGEWVVLDERGTVIYSSPTNAAAWAWIDRTSEERATWDQWMSRARNLYGRSDGVQIDPFHQKHDALKESAMGVTTYDNTNSGALFRNDDKANDKSPDYRGTLDVGGIEHWLNGWIKTSRKGVKFLSLSIKPKEEKVDRTKPLKDDIKDSIPF